MMTEMNLFNPLDLDLSRSTFHMEPVRSTTFNAGRLIPTFHMPVIPGDSIRMDVDTLIKMSTPVYPTMDNLYADVFFFYVSFDLLLGRRYGTPNVNDSNQSWKAIVGAQTELLNMPVPEGLPSLPFVETTGTKVGSLLEYLGYDGKATCNCLPVLAYVSIYNEDFRDPNVMLPVTWSFSANHAVELYGDVPLIATPTEVYVDAARSLSDEDYFSGYFAVNAIGYDDTDDAIGAEDADEEYSYCWLPFPVCVFHGMFGSALPWPQRNTEGVELPLGAMAPVVTGATHENVTGSSLVLRSTSGSVSAGSAGLFGASTGSGVLKKFVVDDPDNPGSSLHLTPFAADGADVAYHPVNLWTDLSKATAANVNALRSAIQWQRFFEKLSRSGNRYDELKYGLFGVRSGDSLKDKPLYLGGKRICLNVDMVASTNGGTDSDVADAAGSLGQLGAYSHTNDSDHYFYHSFTDWGIIMCLVTVRAGYTFASGVDSHMMKFTREHMYFPTFAHLGEQLLSGRLISSGSGNFGYQQAWEELRQIPNRVGGRLKTDLSFMTFADKFDSMPSLAYFLNASRYVKNVDNVLKVTSVSSGFQFIIQQKFNITARRPLPVYSIPGLMDHF